MGNRAERRMPITAGRRPFAVNPCHTSLRSSRADLRVEPGETILSYSDRHIAGPGSLARGGGALLSCRWMVLSDSQQPAAAQGHRHKSVNGIID